jgi:hypothetical protein
MKPHRILKSFKGSHEGHITHLFEADTVAPLSDSLAAIVVKEGWAEPEESPAEEREMKVTGPDETKSEDDKPKKKKG